MEDVVAHPNCYKHGLSYKDVLSAWSNALAYTVRESFSGDRMVVIGYDTHARLCEVIGLRKGCGWLLIHAMTPQTRKTMLEMSEGGQMVDPTTEITQEQIDAIASEWDERERDPTRWVHPLARARRPLAASGPAHTSSQGPHAPSSPTTHILEPCSSPGSSTSLPSLYAHRAASAASPAVGASTRNVPETVSSMITSYVGMRTSLQRLSCTRHMLREAAAAEGGSMTFRSMP